MVESPLVRDILSGKGGGIVVLYNDYKTGFISWAMHKFSVSKEDALDIFQDAVISFYKNIKQGKIRDFQYSPKTYLFSIGRNLLLNKVKFEKRFDRGYEREDLETINLPADPEVYQHVRQDVKDFVDQILKKLGNPCYTILRLFYYENYSLEAIAAEIHSKSANVAKAQKSRCIKTLKKMLLDKFDEKDFF